jgi:homogentisate 1,2-dioxygenase
MLDRLCFGEVPAKHHTALRSASGRLRYEACMTRKGFDGPYTIAYHEQRPQALQAEGAAIFEPYDTHVGAGARLIASGLSRHHYPTLALGKAALERPSLGAGSPAQAPLPAASHARVPLLYNHDLVLSCLLPTHSDQSYSINAGADELLFILAGRGTVRSLLGDLEFVAGDYVLLPKGMLYRLIFPEGEPQHFLCLELFGGVGIPARFRNPVGQLRMDAPYSHRDFKRPNFRGPSDEGIREVWIKDGPLRQKFIYPHNPLDVVGWDGSLYPWAFPILSFQPRVSSVHLPPTWHGTFEAQGALICSFVPRPLDFHPEAVPCPYPHLSADVDEVLFYVDGQFSSRIGVGRGSLTLHPAGVPHGPHPGRYEESLGTQRTEEVAVMLDVSARLTPTSQAMAIEASDYEKSFSDASLT